MLGVPAVSGKAGEMVAKMSPEFLGDGQLLLQDVFSWLLPALFESWGKLRDDL
jgi:hypothetical protein